MEKIIFIFNNSGLLLNFFNGSVVYTSSFGSVLDQVGGIVTGAILILFFIHQLKKILNKLIFPRFSIFLDKNIIIFIIKL